MRSLVIPVNVVDCAQDLVLQPLRSQEPKVNDLLRVDNVGAKLERKESDASLGRGLLSEWLPLAFGKKTGR